MTDTQTRPSRQVVAVGVKTPDGSTFAEYWTQEGVRAVWVSELDELPTHRGAVLLATAKLLAYWMLADLARAVDDYPELLDCQSFGELHDVIDANELGGLCDGTAEERLARWVTPRDEEGCLSEEWMQVVNEAQDAVSLLISEAGGVARLMEVRP